MHLLKVCLSAMYSLHSHGRKVTKDLAVVMAMAILGGKGPFLSLEINFLKKHLGILNKGYRNSLRSLGEIISFQNANRFELNFPQYPRS